MMFRPETIHIDTWPAVHALLEPAIAFSGDTVSAVIDDLLSGEAQLWVLRSKGGDPIAAAVSELEDTPRGQFVHGRLLGGHGMAEWIDQLILDITAHGKAANAEGIRIEGRPGWERVLRAKGWHRQGVIMEIEFAKELSDG